MLLPQTRSFRRTIRFWLNYLVLACILPAIAVATFLITRSYGQERKSLERNSIATARALMQAVDAELLGIESALKILALSADLASGDLAGFYDQAQNAVAAAGVSNMVLTDATGQQLINTLRPFGAPLPRHGNPAQLRRVIDTGKPAISELYTGAASRAAIIVVEVPVFSEKRAVYALGAGLFPERLADFLKRQKIPAGWVAGILDSTGTIVARTVNSSQYLGQKGSTALLHNISGSPEGTFDGLTLEGTSVLSVFNRSTSSGWAIAIGIPQAQLTAQLRHSILMNAVAAVIILVIGVLLARAISRRISRSIRSLTEPALALGTSRPLLVPPLAIEEAHELGQALVKARELIEQRAAERDQAQASLLTATRERDDLRRRIMRAQEQERLRLAHDLHDQTGQSLTAAILELKGVEALIDERASRRLRLLRKQMEEMGKALHRVAWELRPASIDELGLGSALANYIAEWSAQYGIAADFHCTDPRLDELPDELRTTLYRVVQEALTNVAKHANGSRSVSVVIERIGASLRLIIEDDGCGFENLARERNDGLGILGMRERLSLIGGKLEIETSNKAGTTVFARIPLKPERLTA
jgi:signal transduction histidine kinase